MESIGECSTGLTLGLSARTQMSRSSRCGLRTARARAASAVAPGATRLV